MACAALFSIVLPHGFPNTFLTLFLIFSIIGGNYKFKFKLIVNNSVALLAIAIFLLFVISLAYTSAPAEDTVRVLRKHGRYIYIPLLLGAFHEQYWKRIGYIAFLSGVTLILLMSYMLLLPWLPETIYLISPYYSGNIVGKDPHVPFHNYVVHGIFVAYAAYLYFHLALDTDNKIMRILFIVLAALASCNILLIVESRTAHVLWVVLILLLIYQHLGWKHMVLGLVAIPVLAVTTVSFNDRALARWVDLRDDLESIKQGDYNSSFGQRALWTEVGWDMFRDNPVLGTGVGSFKSELRKRLEVKRVANPEEHYNHNPHNEYVSVGVQLGLTGLVFLIALYIQQWRISSHLVSFSNYAARGLVVVVVVSSIMGSITYPRAEGLFFVLLTALFFSAYPSNRNQMSPRPLK